MTFGSSQTFRTPNQDRTSSQAWGGLLHGAQAGHAHVGVGGVGSLHADVSPQGGQSGQAHGGVGGPGHHQAGSLSTFPTANTGS